MLEASKICSFCFCSSFYPINQDVLHFTSWYGEGMSCFVYIRLTQLARGLKLCGFGAETFTEW